MISFHLNSQQFAMRPAQTSDLDGLKSVLADPDIMKTLLGDTSTPEGLDNEARKWIDDEDFWTRHRFGSWAVFDRASDDSRTHDLLGIVAASPSMAGRRGSVEIFYFFRRDCWGRGVASETAERMCRYLLDDLRTPSLEASVFAELNPGSVRVLQKLGMQPAGRVSLRDHGLDDARIEEVVVFDLWRVRTSSPAMSGTVIREAAFRIGQTLAEGLGTLAERKSQLFEALVANGTDGESYAEVIQQQLAKGQQAKGMALYTLERHKSDA